MHIWLRFILLVWGGIVLLVPSAMAQPVGTVERMVEGRAKKVDMSDRAEIERSPPITPVRKGATLQLTDVIGLEDQIWLEMAITRPGIEGHTILAERGRYEIESLQPDGALRFRIRQGRMFVNLKRGELAVYVKDRLISIFGTEAFMEADTTGVGDLVYLKQGHIAFMDANGQVLLDVNGKDQAWRWPDGQLPVRLSGEAFKRWQDQAKYDGSKVWKKPFFKQAWVQVGVVALVGGAVYCAVGCGCARTCSGDVQGTIQVTIPQ